VSVSVAVAACARRLGIPVDAPRVLHDGYNLVVHLAPAPVVAKVMTLFAGDDAAYWRDVAAREVAVAAHPAVLRGTGGGRTRGDRSRPTPCGRYVLLLMGAGDSGRRGPPDAR
jgi:hypothetical protein